MHAMMEMKVGVVYMVGSERFLWVCGEIEVGSGRYTVWMDLEARNKLNRKGNKYNSIK